MLKRSPLTPQRFFGSAAPPTEHLLALVRHWAEVQPDITAFSFTDGETVQQRLTYSQLWDEIRGLAGALQGQIKPGQRILLLYPPGLDFVIGLFACHALDAIAVPAYPPRRNRRASRIRSIVEDADTRIAFSIESVADQLVADNRHEDVEGVTVIGTDSKKLRDLDSWKQPQSLSGDSLAVLQYTSGSTGSPKGVMLTHNNLLANCALILEAFEPERSYQVMAWLPAYHDMGLVGGILQPMYTGRSATLMSPMAFLQRPAKWLQTMSREKIEISGGPNFGYQLCVDKIDDDELVGVDLSNWRIAFNGAEPIRPKTLDAFVERFGPYGFRRDAFLPCYGMAETTLLVTGGPKEGRPVTTTFDGSQLDQRKVVVDPNAEHARTLVGCGRIISGESVEIVSPDTFDILAPGEIGEIWIQSPSVGQGYWQALRATEKTFHGMTADGQGPFLRSGDLGFLHDGQLYISGRLKDMIIVRGVNRYPQDIEQTVEMASDAVQAGSVAAFAMTLQDREHLVIVAETIRQRGLDWDAHLQSIRRAVNEEHELPPDAVYLVRNSSVPKTSSGKIQRHACMEAVRDGDLKVIAKWVRWEEIAGVVRSGGPTMMTAGSASRSFASRSAADTTAQLADQSLSSMDRMIISAVEHQIRKVAGERAGSLTPQTNIVLDLGLDSLERLEIARGLEDTFGGRFPQEVLDSIETIAETARAIAQYLPQDGIARAVKRIAAGDFSRALNSADPGSDISLDPAAPAIEPEDGIEQFGEYKRLRQNISQMLMTGVPNPYFTVHDSIVRDTTVVGGKELISFASYNYLGMSGDPRVSEAAIEAIRKYGTSVSASRLVSGEKPVHGQLENRIANWIGVDAAITMVGGHATNETTIGHLLGPGDLIVHDSLSHNSIVQGALLSGARRRAFPHNDYEALDELLGKVRSQYRRVLVIVEGVYSMDGDFANVPAFIKVKRKHRAMLMVDEAHSMGTMGRTGHGISEHFALNPHDVDIWMGTLSKSMASCGGYIAGPSALVEYLRYTAPGFVFSVGLPPSSAAAALASMDVLEQEPGRVETLRQRSKLFLSLARDAGLDTGDSGGTPVIPVITGNSMVALRLSHRMSSDGVNVQPILYPAVDESSARLRFFMTSVHSEDQIRYTVQRVIHHMEDLGQLARPIQPVSAQQLTTQQSSVRRGPIAS